MFDFSGKGKKVAVLGLGMEGQDFCQFLLKKGTKITVFDQKNASKPAPYRMWNWPQIHI